MTQITLTAPWLSRVLGALEGFAYHGKAAGWPETITNLRAALAQQAEPRPLPLPPVQRPRRQRPRQINPASPVPLHEVHGRDATTLLQRNRGR
jgi:hypothetical protein